MSDSMARQLFEAYNAGMLRSGCEPAESDWDELDEHDRAGWIAAAECAEELGAA